MTTTRIAMTADQAETVARKLRRPNLLGAALQAGRHGYIELDVQARTRQAKPYGAIWEIAPDGSTLLAAGEDLEATARAAADPQPGDAFLAHVAAANEPEPAPRPEDLAACGGCGRQVDATTPRCETCGYPDGAEMIAKAPPAPTLTLTVLSGPDDDPLIAVGGRMAADDAGTYLAHDGAGWARDDDHEPPHWLNEAMDHAFEEWSARSLQAAQAERAAGWPTP